MYTATIYNIQLCLYPIDGYDCIYRAVSYCKYQFMMMMKGINDVIIYSATGSY